MPVKKSTKKVVKKATRQKMVDFKTSVNRFWTKYTDFEGTAQRSEYWFAVLFLISVDFVLNLFTGSVPFMGVLYWVWSVAIAIPSLSLGARRLHDAGFSAKWLLGALVAILVGVVFLFMGYFSLLFIFLSEVSWVIAGGFGIFLFVVSLLPSKLTNNPYRK